jgi:very-long-chain enoyl-CoA reductase
VEYFGPIFITLALYFGQVQIYRLDKPVEHTFEQNVATCMVLAHYIKREFETLFVHRFSNDTMPFTNVFKNSTHYWVFFGLFSMYFVLHPLYTHHGWSREAIYVMIGVFSVSEFLNLMCHITLRNLRKPGTSERNIPKGWGFDLVSCANYFYESICWLVFAVFTQAAGSWFFFIVSTVQMYDWAVKKHIRYRKDFPNYPKGRKAMFPFLL